MIYYSKVSATSSKDDIYALFLNSGASPDEIILDCSTAQKNPNGIFQTLKKEILQNKETLVIDSLRSLGKNNREISKELQWFKQNNIRLIVLDLPSTLHEEITPIQLLSEIYESLAAVEIKNVKENQKLGIDNLRQKNLPLGRKRIPYPENWDELYHRWERKEITAAEFMDLTGLKKGTLYNLIKQYKETKAIAKQA